MESIIPGVPDRGGNDHYALRGRLAWQPGDSTDVDLIVRYLKADKETQAGLYSHEPACPNAEFQGEFTPPRNLPARSGARGPGESGTGFREDSIIPSRGGDPWKTAETEPSYVDREIFGAQVRVDSDFGGAHLHVDHRLPDLRQVLHRGRRRLAGRRACTSSRAATSTRSRRSSACAWTAGDHQLVAGVFGMKVDGDYIGKFADPFYGYDPDVAFTQETTSYAAFLQDEWSFSERWKLIARPALLARHARGLLFRQRAGSSGPHAAGHDHLRARTRSSRTTRTCWSRPRDAERAFDDITARVRARLQAERRPALVPVVQPRQQERRLHVSRPARRTARTRRSS